MSDPRLAIIRSCPERVPTPAGEDTAEWAVSTRATCRAGRGATPGLVTLRDCLDCATGPRSPDRRYPFTKDVLFRAALTSWTGYGQIGEWLGRGLESLGLGVGYADTGTDPRYLPQRPWVSERSVPPWEEAVWSILLAPPYEANPAGRVVRFTMWETSRITPAATANLNASELVCVPCGANRRWFTECGVKTPIAVVPMGVSPGEGYRDDRTPLPRNVCRFGMAGRMAHGGIRKGLNEGMEAFVAAFARSVTDVELVLKVWPDCLGQLRVPDDPRIKVVTTPMQPREMAEWYRTLTALFVPSKGEGWGLHTQQAMAVGRPVIAVPWGGTAEFWDERCGWALEYDLAPDGDFYAGQGEWAVPRHDSMVDRLRQVYSDRDEAVARGQMAARRAAEFTWDRTARCLYRALIDAGLLEPAGRNGSKCDGGNKAAAPQVDGAVHRSSAPGDDPNIPIVIMTASRPEPYLRRTLGSLDLRRPVTLMVGTLEMAYLEEHRSDPLLRIVVPAPAEYEQVAGSGVRQHAAWNYWRCLGESKGRRRLLIIEDDVRFAVGWEARLAAIVGRIERDNTDYVLSLYYPFARGDDGGNRYIIYNQTCFYGTQGILFAGRALSGYRRYLREWGVEGWVKPYDLLLEDFVRAMDIPLFAAMPSLVQHTGAVTTGQSDGFHTTACFEENVEGP